MIYLGAHRQPPAGGRAACRWWCCSSRPIRCARGRCSPSPRRCAAPGRRGRVPAPSASTATAASARSARSSPACAPPGAARSAIGAAVAVVSWCCCVDVRMLSDTAAAVVAVPLLAVLALLAIAVGLVGPGRDRRGAHRAPARRGAGEPVPGPAALVPHRGVARRAGRAGRRVRDGARARDSGSRRPPPCSSRGRTRATPSVPCSISMRRRLRRPEAVALGCRRGTSRASLPHFSLRRIPSMTSTSPAAGTRARPVTARRARRHHRDRGRHRGRPVHDPAQHRDLRRRATPTTRPWTTATSCVRPTGGIPLGGNRGWTTSF